MALTRVAAPLQRSCGGHLNSVASSSTFGRHGESHDVQELPFVTRCARLVRVELCSSCSASDRLSTRARASARLPVLGNALLPTIVRRSSGRMERPVSCRCCRGQRGRIRMRSTTATPSLAVASPISLPATWWRRSGGAVAHRISTRKLQPTIPQRRSFICSGRCSSTIADRSSFRGRDSRATSPDEVGFYLLTAALNYPAVPGPLIGSTTTRRRQPPAVFAMK